MLGQGGLSSSMGLHVGDDAGDVEGDDGGFAFRGEETVHDAGWVINFSGFTFLLRYVVLKRFAKVRRIGYLC